MQQRQYYTGPLSDYSSYPYFRGEGILPFPNFRGDGILPFPNFRGDGILPFPSGLAPNLCYPPAAIFPPTRQFPPPTPAGFVSLSMLHPAPRTPIERPPIVKKPLEVKKNSSLSQPIKKISSSDEKLETPKASPPSTVVYDPTCVVSGKPLTDEKQSVARLEFARVIGESKIFKSESSYNLGMVEVNVKGTKRLLIASAHALTTEIKDNPDLLKQTLVKALYHSRMENFYSSDQVFFVNTSASSKNKTNTAHRFFGFGTPRLHYKKGQLYLCAEAKLAAEFLKIKKNEDSKATVGKETHIMIKPGTLTQSCEVHFISSCDECKGRIDHFKNASNKLKSEKRSMSPPRLLSLKK